MEAKTKNTLYFLILPLTLLAIAVFIAQAQTKQDFLLHVDFLDIGQGDSIFIKTAEGNQVMIDGGPNGKILSELSKQMPFWDRTIDLLILTHPDADHSAGFIDVLKRYKVQKILLTKVAAPTAVYEEFTKLLDREGAEKIYAHEGQRIWLDSSTVFDIYYPGLGVENNKSLSTNNTGIFGKLIFGKTKILFTADTDSIVEDSVNSRYNLDSDILKVGHHGSRYSTSAQFLSEVTPQYAVIQVGEKNNYGHPTAEVLANLAAAKAEIYRTDTDGAIGFISDGASLYKK